MRHFSLEISRQLIHIAQLLQTKAKSYLHINSIIYTRLPFDYHMKKHSMTPAPILRKRHKHNFNIANEFTDLPACVRANNKFSCDLAYDDHYTPYLFISFLISFCRAASQNTCLFFFFRTVKPLMYIIYVALLYIVYCSELLHIYILMFSEFFTTALRAVLKFSAFTILLRN